MYNADQVDLATVVLKAMALGATACGSVLALCHGAVVVPLYLLFLVVFHMSEFFTTYWYNPTEVESDSFLLEDYQMMAANAAAIVEYSLKSWLGIAPNLYLVGVGFAVAAVGQYFRTVAMYTAGTSFNHIIQRQHRQKHTLVTHGVYAWVRHPSYFGFWWWFIGLQVMAQNVVVGIAGGYVLWKFFRGRIVFEEGFLYDFFGDDYRAYARKTPVAIPGIVGSPHDKRKPKAS
ncbi:protein-S-isoprenylcysteine O-methyltransferase [Diutina catenulata]